MKDVSKHFKVGNLVRTTIENRDFKQPLGIVLGFTNSGALKVRWSNGTSDIHREFGLVKVA